ncbi:MAG: hypothetical protein RI911_124 [Candidatus Parcubacteria bacterium]|jgi:hypothetical protein
MTAKANRRTAAKTLKDWGDARRNAEASSGSWKAVIALTVLVGFETYMALYAKYGPKYGMPGTALVENLLDRWLEMRYDVLGMAFLAIPITWLFFSWLKGFNTNRREAKTQKGAE